MKEAAYADELKALEEFKPHAMTGLSKNREREVVNVEEDPYADIDQVMLNVDDLVSEQAANVEAEKEKEDEVDETERLRRIQEATEKEKQLKKRKRQEKDDAAYVPSPEHVSESQSPLSGKKKAGARKRIVSPKIKKVTKKITKPKIVLKNKSAKQPSKPPTPPPPDPTPHQSPIQSPPHQTLPRQPSPPKQQTPPRQPSPLHLSPLHISPPHQQTLFTSQEIFQAPPLTQFN
ncbi:RNA-binding protein 33-like [Helianthus annuus]|uniref:RNA-binding protein 33-like n=1 Tax=Helianthus annuus TaxID=4232 RepID=UPI000B8EFA9F|nr:RNA-binding protein 33-like [Helianthus annuus]